LLQFTTAEAGCSSPTVHQEKPTVVGNKRLSVRHRGVRRRGRRFSRGRTFGSSGSSPELSPGLVHKEVFSSMEFCPTCGNIAQYDISRDGEPAKFFCRSCPYICHLDAKVKIKRGVQLAKKEAEPMTVAEKNVGPITDASCPKCGHGKATYQQIQIRSADEPMTIFYECLNKGCGHRWRED
ncbi:hypothetical protein V2J09_000947, partial [Rumex salicifolius]